MADDIAPHRDFFISRADADKGVAKLVAQILRAAGFTTWLQDENFGSASFMAQGRSGSERLICLLSDAYQRSDHCKKEYDVALHDDLRNIDERVIVLRLEDCAPSEHLADLAYTDLVPVLNDAEALARVVRGAVAPGRDRAEADFAALHRRAPQILHPDVRPVPSFAGREAELAALEEALWRQGGTAALTDALANLPASAAALKGLGGVGKSVLAREYAWCSRARYQGIWWVRAEQCETLADDLIELGARFIAGLKQMPERDQAARRALDWIGQAGFEKPWLLVYDNVEEPGHIEDLMPRTGAHVLITTRQSDWGTAAPPVTIGAFPPEVAADFLLESTGRTDRVGAEKLAAALGHLPLALDHAAAYIRRTGIDFATYEALAADLLTRAPKGGDYDTPVLATFSLAIDEVSEACPEAQKLMGLCAFLAPDRIPISLFTDDVLSEIVRGEAVAALQEVSLLTLEPLDDGSPGISMHRLVQATMRGRLEEIGEHENAAALATELVADAYPSPASDVSNWPACARLTPHAVAVFEHAPDSGNGADETARLLRQTALNYVSRAAHAEAEPLYRRALAIDEASLGPDHPSVATSLNNLGLVLQATGRLAEAEPLYRRALAIDEASLGPDHPSVATSLNNLGLVLQATGRLAEAEPLYRRALAIDEASLGPDHPSVATSLNNLGLLLQATGRLAEVEPPMRRAVEIFETFERDTGRRHPHYQAAREELAALLLEAAMRAAGAPIPAKPDATEPLAASAAPQARKRGFMGGLFPRV